MADVGHMNFFKVNDCGLYKVKDEQPYGCELDETFSLIKDWVKDRPLSATLVWSADKNKPKCYCREVEKDPVTGDYLVVLWKSESDRNGAIFGAAEDTENGLGEVYEYSNEVKGKKIIWGRPCYYWVIPSLNTIVSIRFDHSLCDSQMFEDYVSDCVNKRVSHPNRVKEYTEHGFTRLSYKDDVTNYKFRYRFSTSLRSLNTSNAELGKLVNKITHIIWRETIQVKVENQRSDWLKRFDRLPFVSNKPKSSDRNIEIKAEAKSTIHELREIIDTYAKENRRPSDWENVGFIADNTITWVDKYRLKDQISISGNTSKTFKASFLLQEINKNRNAYLNPLEKAINSNTPSANKEYRIGASYG